MHGHGALRCIELSHLSLQFSIEQSLRALHAPQLELRPEFPRKRRQLPLPLPHETPMERGVPGDGLRGKLGRNDPRKKLDKTRE